MPIARGDLIEISVEKAGLHLAKESVSSGKLTSILSYFILVGGMYALLVSGLMVIICYTPLPFWDQWATVDQFVHKGTAFSFFRSLWAQHNEHRIFFPHLLTWVDFYLFNGTNVFLLASIFTIQIVHLGVLGFLFRRIGGISGPAWRTLLGFACFCLFCPIQWENLIWGFQTAFVLLSLAATLSFTALALYGESNVKSRYAYLLLSFACAFVGSFCVASGLLLWPVLLVAAYTMRLSRKVLLSFLIGGILVMVFYLHGYSSPPHNLHPLHSLFEPSQLARYVATYFSGIWLIFGINPARLIAAASVIWASITYLRKVCSRIQPSNSEVVLLSLGMFVIASAGITAIGRVNFGMEQAFASRYQTFALLYWLSVAALCLHFGWARRSTNVRFVMFQVLLLVMVVANDIYARKWVTEARSHSALTRSAGAALAVGVSDTKLLQRLFPSSAWVLADRAFLQDNHFSIFSDSYYRALNRKADSLYRRAPASDCAGSLQTTELLGGPSPGYGASGWAWSVKERRAAERILLVIEDGTVIGFGVGLEPHAKLAQIIPFMKAASVGWLGDLQRPNHRVHVTAYALVEGDSALCPLAGDRELD